MAALDIIANQPLDAALLDDGAPQRATVFSQIAASSSNFALLTALV
jgi:hypothetical protein